MFKKILSFFTLTVISVAVFAQDVKVSGKVSDNKGDAMSGASVVVKGTNLGVKTSADGSYTITIPSINIPAVLQYRSVGVDVTEFVVDGLSAEVSNDVSLGATQKFLNEVVVSASKKSEKILNAPASISVISAAKMTQNTPLSVIDNVKSLAAVDVMPTGLVSNNVNVRGFNGIFSGSLLYLVDNRIASVPSLKVNAFNLIPTSNSDLRSMEILRGPASALYGPNAANGALAIYTKNPLDMENRMEVTVGMTTGFRSEGDDATIKNTNGTSYTRLADNSLDNRAILMPELRIAGKISDRLGVRLSGSYMKASDYEWYDSREPNGNTVRFGNQSGGTPWASDGSAPATFNRDFGIKKINGDARVDWRPTDDVEFSFHGGYANNTNIELTGLGAAQAKDWTSTYFQTQMKVQRLWIQYFINTTNSGNTYLIPENSSNNQFTYLKETSNMQGLQLQSSSDFFSKKLGLVYGIDVFSTRPSGNVYGRFNGKSNINQYGFYAQGDYKFNKQFSFVAASRLDYQDAINEWMFSPRAALIYKPKEDQTLRLTYNRAFTSPSALNFYLDINNGSSPFNANGNIRAYGNTTGFNYNRDASGNLYYRNDLNGSSMMLNNPATLTTITGILNQLAASNPGLAAIPSAQRAGVVSAIYAGNIQTPINITTFGTAYGSALAAGQNQIAALTSAISASKLNASTITDLSAVQSTVTQTAEIGYKGNINKKLFIGLDLYYTRIDNFVSPLTSASYAVMPDIAQLAKNVAATSAISASYPALIGSLFDLNKNGTALDDIAGLYAAAVGGNTTNLSMGTIMPKNYTSANDLLLTYVNLGTVDMAGADLSMKFQATKDLSFDGAFSFMNKDRIPLQGASDGYVALNAPKYKSALGFDYKLPIKSNVTVRGNWRWMDAFPANSAVYTGMVNPMNMIDMGLSWKPAGTNNTTIALNITNLMDYRHIYFPGTSPMGRLVMLKVVHTFGVK
jgi:iron complex outermembrane receptor protein